MICYKFQRIKSSYLNFSEIPENKTVKVYKTVKLKILSLQLHKCTHFSFLLNCLLNVSDYLL